MSKSCWIKRKGWFLALGKFNYRDTHIICYLQSTFTNNKNYNT